MTKITIFALLVLAAVLGPFAIIWSLNTLFPILAIPYGFLQWFAIVVMNSAILVKQL